MKKNCDVVIDITKERIENYLQECLWRVARLHKLKVMITKKTI